MSKSKGNIIDPLEIIDAYGTDAMRMALCASVYTSARQIDLDRRRFEEFKNFANKIWNGARFVFMNFEGVDLSSGLDSESAIPRRPLDPLPAQTGPSKRCNAALGSTTALTKQRSWPTTSSGKSSAPIMSS